MERLQEILRIASIAQTCLVAPFLLFVIDRLKRIAKEMEKYYDE